MNTELDFPIFDDEDDDDLFSITTINEDDLLDCPEFDDCSGEDDDDVDDYY